jgi:hypothetical protein
MKTGRPRRDGRQLQIRLSTAQLAQLEEWRTDLAKGLGLSVVCRSQIIEGILEKGWSIFASEMNARGFGR